MSASEARSGRELLWSSAKASSVRAPLGYGLYFLDVLACTLFCLAFTLVSARFRRETAEAAIAVELPRAPDAKAAGSALPAASLVVRGDAASPELLLDGEPVDLAGLEERLRSAPPPALRVRGEDSPLVRAIAIAHAAGVLEIELAYAPRVREAMP